MRWLYLDDNGLSGAIPPELGNLTNLEWLHLDDNGLSGAIPPDLGNLTNLWGLDLRSNNLNGLIPPELGNLTNLRWMHLSGNDLCIPADHRDEDFFSDLDFPICVEITVSPATTVTYTEKVTLTAHASDPVQVASYRWAHVGGSQNLSTQQSVTLGGSGWPNGPGTRTFQAIVTLNDGFQVVAEQAITFTDPPPPEDVSVSITVSPSTTVAYTEEVTLTANVPDSWQAVSYTHLTLPTKRIV